MQTKVYSDIHNVPLCFAARHQVGAARRASAVKIHLVGVVFLGTLMMVFKGFNEVEPTSKIVSLSRMARTIVNVMESCVSERKGSFVAAVCKMMHLGVAVASLFVQML